MMITLAFILKKAAEEDYRFHKMQSDYTKQTGINVSDMLGTVATVMKHPPICVPPTMRISEFIDGILAKHRQTHFPVAHDGRLLALEKLRAVPERDWEKTIVRDVMHPVDDSLFVPMKASIEHATNKLRSSPLQYLAVIDSEGILVGSLSAAELERVA
jgi:CBS domain-containing protein